MNRRFSLCVFLFVILFFSPLLVLSQNTQEELTKAFAFLNRGDYQDARHLFKPLLEKAKNPDRLLITGYLDTYYETGEYSAGLDEITAYLQKFPKNPYLLNYRGRFFAAVGKYKEAEQAFIESRTFKIDYYNNLFDLAELFKSLGRRYEANSLYNEFINLYNTSKLKTAEEIALAAKSFSEVNKIYEANNAFREADKLDSKNVLVLQWWGNLFAEKFNPDQARANYEEALEINPQKSSLYTDYAHSVESFEAMEELAHTALKINPNNVEAHNIVAEIYLLDGKYNEAEQEIHAALAINPSAISTLAYLATIYHLRDEKDQYKQIENKALSINPSPAEFYYIIANNCVGRFRYKDAVAFAYSAVSSDNQNWKAYVMLGTNLMRIGRTQEAYRYLQRAFDNDPFNGYAMNTLNLIDSYKNFDTLESDHFSLLIHKSESGVIGKAILELAEACLDSLSRRYNYIPQGKIIIEAYNNHSDFAVRISGLPGLELIGVCFGEVVAFDTPAARTAYAQDMGYEPQPYNWARTLWHELAHIYALGLSDNRVPRWFTEGLSVYEEQRAQPAWGRDMDLELYAGLRLNKLIPLKEINQGFTRPQFPNQLILTYYQSEKLIDFIVQMYGFTAITNLLIEFKENQDLDKSFLAVLKKTPEQVEKEFYDQLRAQANQYENVTIGLDYLYTPLTQQITISKFQADSLSGENPLFKCLKDGFDSLKQEHYIEAEKKFNEALTMFPFYVDPGNAYEGLMEVYSKTDQTAKLQEIAERYLTLNEYAAEEACGLAQIYQERNQIDKVEYYYRRSFEVQPYNIAAHRDIADFYAENKLYQKEVAQREIVVALEPLDKSQALYYLALSFYNNGRINDAKTAVIKALEIAPGYRDAQKLLLQCIK
jgi:tetratricopeptide (TPR) repeat protein